MATRKTVLIDQNPQTTGVMKTNNQAAQVQDPNRQQLTHRTPSPTQGYNQNSTKVTKAKT